MLFGHKIGAAFGCLIAVLGIGYALLAAAGPFSASNALYLTLLDAAGAAVATLAWAPPRRSRRRCLPSTGWPSCRWSPPR